MKVWIAKPMTNCFSLTPFINLWFYSTVIHLSFGWGKWSITISKDKDYIGDKDTKVRW